MSDMKKKTANKTMIIISVLNSRALSELSL